MTDELRGKVIAVTGASSGIGLAIAEALAHHGAAVVGFARRFERERVTRSPEAGSILEVKLDVTDAVAVGQRFEELGALDGVVLSHGGGVFSPAALVDTDELRALLETHVIGSFTVVREAVRVMRARDAAAAGNIVFIGSLATHKPFSDTAAYTAAKMGQLGLARVLGEELRATGIRVTTLVAGAVDTPLWDQRPGFDRERMLEPHDIAGLVVSVLRRPRMAIDEIVVTPPDGAL